MIVLCFFHPLGIEPGPLTIFIPLCYIFLPLLAMHFPLHYPFLQLCGWGLLFIFSMQACFPYYPHDSCAVDSLPCAGAGGGYLTFFVSRFITFYCLYRRCMGVLGCFFFFFLSFFFSEVARGEGWQIKIYLPCSRDVGDGRRRGRLQLFCC